MSLLVGSALDAAVAYNERRGLDPTTVEQIQHVVGAKVDGKLGPRTAQAVFEWQGKIGLVQDGKIGPKTLVAIADAAEQQRPAEPVLGLWVDDRARVVLDERYLDDLVSLRLSTLAIMVHRSTAGRETSWQPRWTAEQLARLRELAQPRNLSIVITTWPLPNRELLATFRRELPPLLAAAGAIGLEVDTEGNWLPSRLDGFADMNEAAAALVDTLREIAAPSNARLELTTYPFHPENGAQAKVAPHMDRVFPQAYSVANRQDKAVSWDEREGPGKLQRFSASRAREIVPVAEGRPVLAMGLAAYDQTFEGHTPIEALKVAFDTAHNVGVAEVRYWSSKWILGHMRADSPAEQFLFSRATGSVARAATGRTLIHPVRPDAELARIDGDDDFHQTRELEDMRAGMTYKPIRRVPAPSSEPASSSEAPVDCPTDS